MVLGNYQELEIPSELVAKFNKPILTQEEATLRKRILASHWLLLKNVYGFKCRRCNQKHTYFTSYCIEQPFNGLNQIVAVLKKQSVVDEYRADNKDWLVQQRIFEGLELGDVVPITLQEAENIFATIRWRQGVIVMPNGRVVRNRRRFS